MTALLMGYARSQRSGAGSNRERAPPIAAALADDQPDLATSEWQASVPQGIPFWRDVGGIHHRLPDCLRSMFRL